MRGPPASTLPSPIRLALAEFNSPEALLSAIPIARARGYSALETHTPFPVHGEAEALGRPPSRIPLVVLVSGLAGTTLAFLLQYGLNAVDYPLNVGGRPMFSLPAWVPVMFEVSVLLGAFGAFFGVWGLSGLPRPYHPVFLAERFRSASVDGFWLRIGLTPTSIQTSTPTSTEDELIAALVAAGAQHVEIVEGLP